ncbi:hypothetical protein D3C71_77370 [compost metagenome]
MEMKIKNFVVKFDGKEFRVGADNNDQYPTQGTELARQGASVDFSVQGHNVRIEVVLCVDGARANEGVVSIKQEHFVFNVNPPLPEERLEFLETEYELSYSAPGGATSG